MNDLAVASPEVQESSSEDDEPEIAEFTEKLKEILGVVESEAKLTSKSVTSLLNKVNNQPSTSKGLSFLQVKNQLLLQYLISLAGISLVKASGKSIQGSPLIDLAIQMRVYLEKLRPIDQKLKYQVDKLLRMGLDEEKAAAEKDPLKHRANLANLVSTGKEGENSSSEDDEEEDEAADNKEKSKSDVYRPPKVTPQFFDDEPKSSEKTRKKNLVNRALIREMQEEFLETPVEIHNMGDAYAKKLSQEAKEKQRFEETYMTRLPMTKREKHRSKSMSTMGVLGDEITDFSSRRSSEGGAGKKGKGKKRKSKGGKGGGKKGGKRRKTR